MPEISEERLKELNEAEKLSKELKSENEELTEQNKELTETTEELEESIKEKDELIKEKNDQIVGVRKKYSEMNAEEKEELTERERALMQEQEALDQKMADFEKKQKEEKQKEIESRKKAAFKDLVGEDEELQEKLDYHYGRIKDSDDASTPDEIRNLAEDALSMLSKEAPDAVEAAVNSPKKGPSGDTGDKDFSESPEGEELRGKMGLSSDEGADDSGQSGDDTGGNPLDRA